MLELLKPFEDFLHHHLHVDWLRGFFFQLFKVMHLYLYEYTDYLIFGVFAVPLYYLLPKTWRVHYLILASMVMIGVLHGFIFAFFLIAVPMLFYVAVKRLQPKALIDATFQKQTTKLLVSLALLIYGILLIRESYEWEPALPLTDRHFIVPLLHWCGIAFMLPKLIHYIVDSLKGTIGTTKASHFALFMVFFPILRLGPIERFQTFERSLVSASTRSITAFDIGFGLYRIFLGAVKTALYAAVLYPWREDACTHIPDLSIAWIYWLLLMGIVEVYCHFGGYTDIALGFSRLFGIRVSENFYLPVFSENIGEWWRRWHITLSFWMRDYVYRPLGGGRKNAFINGMITFFFVGAWHYLAWHYIVWGLLQGIGIAIMRLWQIFWHRVANEKEYWNSLKPVAFWMKAHPRFSSTVSALFTIHYFFTTGLYFILDIDRANLVILRLFTLGAYPY